MLNLGAGCSRARGCHVLHASDCENSSPLAWGTLSVQEQRALPGPCERACCPQHTPRRVALMPCALARLHLAPVELLRARRGLPPPACLFYLQSTLLLLRGIVTSPRRPYGDGNLTAKLRASWRPSSRCALKYHPVDILHTTRTRYKLHKLQCRRLCAVGVAQCSDATSSRNSSKPEYPAHDLYRC